MKEFIDNLNGLYTSIVDIDDLPTRRILYIQFISKYYPEAFRVLATGDLKDECIKAALSSSEGRQ